MTDTQTDAGGGAKPRMTNLDSVPEYARADYIRRNQNIKAGVTLCKRCGGTGNEVLSRYYACQACGGDGVSKGNEAQYPD